MYIPKNILITGGCGFIASNFINYIYNQLPNLNIINIDAMYYCANEQNINENIRNSNRYTFIKGNICSTDLISYILKSNNIVPSNTEEYQYSDIVAAVYNFSGTKPSLDCTGKRLASISLCYGKDLVV